MHPCVHAVRRSMLVMVVAVVGVVPVVAAADAPPPGATARCRDGKLQLLQHHSGTCSHHGGVAAWLNGTSSSSSGATQGVEPPVAVGRTVLLAPRTRTSSCHRDPEPDRRCSPGATTLASPRQ